MSNFPPWARSAIIILITVIITILVLLFLPDASGEATKDEPPSKYEAHFLEIEKQAIDEALRNQIAHLYLTWLKDDAGQPQRAIVGARKARKAYVDIMNAIERREQSLPNR